VCGAVHLRAAGAHPHRRGARRSATYRRRQRSIPAARAGLSILYPGGFTPMKNQPNNLSRISQRSPAFSVAVLAAYIFPKINSRQFARIRVRSRLAFSPFFSAPSASSAVKKVWLWLAVAVVLTGCAVGPNYHRPPITPPTAFRGEVTPSNAASLADAKWFE